MFLGSTILLHNERSESPSHLTALRTPSSPFAPSSSREHSAHSLPVPFLYPGPTKGCCAPPFNSDLSGAGPDEADGSVNTLLPSTGRSGLVILEVIFRFPTLAFPTRPCHLSLVWESAWSPATLHMILLSAPASTILASRGQCFSFQTPIYFYA